MKRPTIHLFSDVLGPYGGIETYLDALARRLKAEGWPVRVAVCCNDDAPFLDDLAALGIPVYRQPAVPGDRWYVRQRLLIRRVARQVEPDDWVFCVRAPMAPIYLALVRAVHRRSGKVAASWALAPEFLPAPHGRLGTSFRAAIAETDAVISVSSCTTPQFKEEYGYEGPLHVVRYHNRERFTEVVPLPGTGTLEIGFLGRIDIPHKNLDTILSAFRIVAARRSNVRLNLHGGGPDMERVAQLIDAAGLGDLVKLHGPYDHRTGLRQIIERNHVFVYTSRYEGGPCFSLIELLQAGRFVVASPVGGIPDIYAGRPEAGELVRQDDAAAIAEALEKALRRVEAGSIEPAAIRAVYKEHFTEDVAHRQFAAALGL
jgi:glycosyltransferase involved in cell wall biosynthesis